MIIRIVLVEFRIRRNSFFPDAINLYLLFTLFHYLNTLQNTLVIEIRKLSAKNPAMLP